ncbi:GDSL-type esterase/lipase family protein [Adhaeretor mobilis]|uniref:Acetylxylan esterase n=1 Tax=Adhaeretor mobilis TaxID=1930276 RepID=A0A517MTI7_9BACT|nr:GDSL-type esterase/lipase family protein [Adhaeretor mobilis]QDS98201.1 Acetylxylan esterase precursor [Adhaeretor mobilis]
MQILIRATVLSTFFLLSTSGLIGAAEPIRLAVIGDSLTADAAAKPNDLNVYSALLAQFLAPEYETRNFARSSVGVLEKAELPYISTPEYQAALSWAPDVIVIMLGTSDSISEPRDNWQHHGDLEGDVLRLIQSFRANNAQVKVHLLGPPPVFPDNMEDNETIERLKVRAARIKEIAAVYRQLALQEPQVFYHDLSRSFSSTIDGVHPDNFGHESLAHEIHDRLVIAYEESCGLEAKLASLNLSVREDHWHGFRRFTFALGKATCHLVSPHQVAKNRQWILRARFFGHEPELDLSLLDRGFHVAYCDVANLYGSEEAIARWDKFYALATNELSLSHKPILEGMSRGGLPIFLWASRNPEKVSAIYGDNPVCNSLSWPGGQNGTRSSENWEQLLEAYGVVEDQAEKLPQPRHAEILEPIAKAKVPIALVLGMADTTVPPSDNALPLAREYRKLGGRVKIWRKPGSGHHPHGLHPPDSLRRYLMRTVCLMENPAVESVPSVEYRAGAGWGSDWQTAFRYLKRVAAAKPDSKVVLLGDSITQGLTGHNLRMAQPDGPRAVDRYLGNQQALCLGLSGDRTEHILWRLQNGQLAELTPDFVVLMIGVNNINSARHTGEETAEGTIEIVRWLRDHKPNSKIILCGCFPTGKTPSDPLREEVDDLHRIIARLSSDPSVQYLDLRSHFLNGDGTLNQNMSEDAVHITRSGQETWMKELEGVLKR